LALDAKGGVILSICAFGTMNLVCNNLNLELGL
jgi:hypothetical protein